MNSPIPLPAQDQSFSSLPDRTTSKTLPRLLQTHCQQPLVGSFSSNLSHNYHNQTSQKNSKSFQKLFFFITKKTIRNRHALHEIFLKPQYKWAEMPQSSILPQPFYVLSSFSSISQPAFYKNEQSGKECKHQPCPLRLASRIHPFIFL